ncbi:hypothetical protein G3I13_21200 [Streptomyces sp. SID6673]|nr:hypothetical protein [Streptomyces sp. SID11726]NEB26857.1 hypothetical protein [Streptomyces sp. SID6673]
MPTPARSDVDMWRPHQMLPVAASLRAVAGSLEAKSGPIRNAVVSDIDRVTGWVGHSRASADDRAEAEKKWLTNLSDNFEDVATAIEQGCANIANQKTALDALQNGALDAGYVLGSTGDTSWTLKRTEGEEEKDGDAAAMESWRARLVAQANEVFHAVQGAASSLQSELGQLTTLTPASLALNGTMGTRDAGMAKDGYTPEELRSIGQHLKDAQLTPEQIKALLDGKTADVPPGVVSYLRNLFGGLSPKDALALRYGLDAGDPAAGTAFANGLNTLGNEKVSGGGTSGGYDELPGWMKDIVGERIPGDRGSDEFANYFARSFALGQLFNGATTQPGTKLGTQLELKSADLAEFARSNPQYQTTMSDLLVQHSMWGEANGLADPAHPDVSDNPAAAFKDRYDDTMRSLLNAGALNHESSTAILTGHGGADVGLPAGYDSNRTLQSLYGFHWEDRGTTVGHLTDWIDDYAGDQGNGYRAGLSADAFRGMYDFNTDPKNFTFLMDMDGTHSGSLGDVNPELAKSLEEATRPYLNVLGGGNPVDHGFGDEATGHLLHLGGEGPEIANDREMQDQVRRLFGVISSGDDAQASLIRDIGIQQAHNAEHVPLALNEGRGFAGDLAARNGWLQSLLRDGVMADQLDDWHDKNPGNDIDDDTVNNLKSNTKDIVTKGLDAVPVVGGALSLGAGIGIDWASLPQHEAGDSGNIPTHVSVNDTLLEQHWSTWAATHPRPTGDIEMDRALFSSDGSLKSLDVVLDQNNPDHGEGSTIGSDQLAVYLNEQLRAGGLELGDYDSTYLARAGNDNDAIDYNSYKRNLLGDK